MKTHSRNLHLLFLEFMYTHLNILLFIKIIKKSSGAGCSKLTTSLVNVSLKFQTIYYKFDFC